MNGLIVDLFAGGGQHTPAESGENSSHGTRCFRAPRHKVCYEKEKARRGTGLRHNAGKTEEREASTVKQVNYE